MIGRIAKIYYYSVEYYNVIFTYITLIWPICLACHGEKYPSSSLAVMSATPLLFNLSLIIEYAVLENTNTWSESIDKISCFYSNFKILLRVLQDYSRSDCGLNFFSFVLFVLSFVCVGIVLFSLFLLKLNLSLP